MKNKIRIIDIIEILEKNKSIEEKYKKIKNIKIEDWEKWCNQSEEKKQIYKNKEYEMIIIKWDTNKESGIHDHPEKGCILKILEGEIEEEIYERKNEEIKYKRKNILNEENDTGFMKGNEIIHSIKNKKKKAYTLNIYFTEEYKPKIYEIKKKKNII